MLCEENGTRVETPSVKPQGDGIHVEVVNNAAGERSFSVETADGSGGMGLGAPPGTSSQIVDLGPGPLRVSCTDPAVEVEGGEPLRIVDEDGIWVPTTLGCPDQFSQVVDYVAGAKGKTSDPIEAARKAVEGYRLEADDVFERAGYPDADDSPCSPRPQRREPRGHRPHGRRHGQVARRHGHRLLHPRGLSTR